MSAPRTGSLGSLNLHATRADHSVATGRIACDSEKEVAYQDFRYW